MIDRKGPYVMMDDSSLEPLAKAGTVVFRLRGWDYGLANDDTRLTDVEHISVTLSPQGDYPSFTVPMDDLRMATQEELDAADEKWGG
jgi:hypothetical protein